MNKQYKAPKAEMMILSAEDVITTSPGLLISGDKGTTGGIISFNEWGGMLGDNGVGEDGDVVVDLGDLGI